MKKIATLLIVICLIQFGYSQTEVTNTFKSTHVINSHSTEMLDQRTLTFVVGHRFGDMFGENGGWATFYGLEQASDVLIGFGYGITDNLNIGIHRTKGAGPLRQNLTGTIKYRILRQMTDGGSPLSLAVVGVSTLSTMQASENPLVINNFATFDHRMTHSIQLLAARKFGERFSLQVAPGYLHRNIVPNGDQNGIFHLGASARIQMTKVLGLILDSNFPFSDLRTSENGYYPSLGVGLEIDTGGHVFQINFTNARGLNEADYIPYTISNWLDGEFRMGFTISRKFRL